MSIDHQFEEAESILLQIMEKVNELDRKHEELKAIIRDLVNLSKKLIDILKTMNKKLDEHTEILKEHGRILNQHTEILKEHGRTLEDHGKRLSSISKDVKDIKVTIRRIVSDIEEEALEIVPIFLEKILGYYIPASKFFIPNVIEINVYGEHRDITMIGECKNRIRISSVVEVLRKTVKYVQQKPDSANKKFLLVLYGLDYIDPAKKLCEEVGIAIITPRGLITQPRELGIEEIKRIYEEIKKRYKRQE